MGEAQVRAGEAAGASMRAKHREDEPQMNRQMNRPIDPQYCHKCEIWLTGREQYEDHKEGTKHRKTPEKLQPRRRRRRMFQYMPSTFVPGADDGRSPMKPRACKKRQSTDATETPAPAKKAKDTSTVATVAKASSNKRANNSEKKSLASLFKKPPVVKAAAKAAVAAGGSGGAVNDVD